MKNNRKLKILVLGPDLQNFTGGIATHLKNIVVGFRDVSAVDVRPFAMTLGLYDKESWVKKIIRNFLNLPALCFNIANADVVHVNSTFDTRSSIRDGFVLSVIFLLQKRGIIQYHGGRPGKVMIWKNHTVKRIYAALLRRCSRVLILSKSQGDEFVGLFYDIKYQQVYNYVNIGNKTTVQDVVHDHRAESPLRFLYIGRIDETKGLKQTLSAVEKLSKEGLRFKLDIAGDGPLRSFLTDWIRERRLDDIITFHGVVGGDEKDRLFEISDVLLLPTFHSEGLPFAVLEAFSHRLAVIGTKAGGMAEALENNINAYTIDAVRPETISRAMTLCLKDREKVGTMGRNGYQKLLKLYTTKQMIATFKDIYFKACFGTPD